MATGEGNYKVTPIQELTGDFGNLEELFGDVLVHAFGEVAAVAPVTETTLASFVVGAGKTVRIKGVYGEGKVDGIFRLYVNGTKVWQARNAWTDRNVRGIIEVDAAAGKTVALKVIHANALSKPFSGSIYGYERG